MHAGKTLVFASATLLLTVAALAATLADPPRRPLAVPTVDIDGPAEVVAGDLAVFRVTGAALSDVAWEFGPIEQRSKFLSVSTADGQSAVIFASRTPGVYEIAMGAASSDGRAVVRLHRFVNRSDPAPGPSPDPTPSPSPVPGPTKLNVTIIEETAQRTPTLAALMASQAVRQYMASQQHAWGIWDKDVRDQNGRVPSALAPYLQMAQGKQLPYLILTDPTGRLLFEGPLGSGSDQDFIAFLKKYGG